MDATIHNQRTARVVDLFAGCGGLSLGFELARESIRFETTMALDNDATVVSCYNDNHPTPRDFASIAQHVDLTWFSHPSEVLLYYLAHLAATRPEEAELRSELHKVGYDEFLLTLNDLDSAFATQLRELASKPSYTSDVSKISKEVFTLAITKSLLNKISISSIRAGKFSNTNVPWRAQCATVRQNGNFKPLGVPLLEIDAIRNSLEDEWQSELEKLRSAATKTGRGQHSVVADRSAELLSFLEGESGRALGALWIGWRTNRDATRANYCLSVYKKLETLYEGNRRVDLILGGPPCKGFSRIARPVMESLRAQGVTAWSSHEFGDERNALMHQYVLFLRALRPDAFLFENVSNFSSVLKTPAGELDAASALEEAIEGLSNHQIKYSITSSLLKASQYGIPQDRHRFFMVGFSSEIRDSAQLASEFFPITRRTDDVPLKVALMGLNDPYEFAHGQGARNPTAQLTQTFPAANKSMPRAWVDYLAWVQQPWGNGRSQTTDSHVFRSVRKDDSALLKRFGPGQRWMDYLVKDSDTLADLRRVLEGLMQLAAEVTPPNDNSMSLFTEAKALLKKADARLALRLILEQTRVSVGEQHLLHEHYLSEGKGHGDWFERLPPNRPSKTIISHIGKDTYSYFHPFETRAITIREAARIQSFPDSFSFRTAGIVDAYSMIGNAVPPLLAAKFAARFSQLHSSVGIFRNMKDVAISDSADIDGLFAI